jgi:aryl-alcohol dehydrogenase-like predicted oxidoreductase
LVSGKPATRGRWERARVESTREGRLSSGRRALVFTELMERRRFGQTDLFVAPLGLGAGAIGGTDLTEDEAGTLLNRAVDLGMNLVDAAPSYGLAEERIGRHLSWRRRDVVLSTKGGYGVPGVPEWTGECIRRGVERALGLFRTDVVDLFHLHSCPLDVLRRDDLLEACRDVARSGKVRVIAYSGEGDALDFAVSCGVFGAVQTSVNVCDQRGLSTAVVQAAARGMGVLAKRPLANAPWCSAPPPHDAAAVEYWKRFHAMGLDPAAPPAGRDWASTFLRFAAYAPGVTACLVGTRRLAHLAECAEAAGAGGLPDFEVKQLVTAFHRVGAGWGGLI